MEARRRPSCRAASGWQFEPKWDGFRCLAIRDGDEVELLSRSGKPLARYFPDMVAALRALKPKRFILDGELAIPVGKSSPSTPCSFACIRPTAACASSPPRRRRS